MWVLFHVVDVQAVVLDAPPAGACFRVAVIKPRIRVVLDAGRPRQKIVFFCSSA